MRRNIFLFLTIIIAISCSRELDIDQDKPGNKLVIYPIAKVNKPIKLLISHSKSIKDTNNVNYFSGKTILIEDDIKIEEIQFENKNIINFSHIVLVNKSYKIICYVDQYPAVECNFETNNFPKLLSVDTFSILPKNPIPILNIHLNILDEKKELTYYRLRLIEKRFNTRFNSFETSKIQFKSNSYQIVFYNWPIMDNKIYLFDEPKSLLENTGLKKEGFIFADEIYFTNEIKTNNVIQLDMAMGVTSRDILMNYSISQVQIEVSAINKDLFMGLYSYAKYNSNTLLDLPIYEENIIYSSVKGGYGFAASFTSAVDSTISSQDYKNFFQK